MRNGSLHGHSYSLVVAFTAILMCATSALAQSSSFTYQGRLTDGGTAANGNYDLQFGLFDSLSGGAQVGSTQSLNTVAVSNGVFTVTLDFGASAFNGASRFLEISARPTGGSFTLLSPRQPITSTPYAVRSSSAANADAATNATNATTATNATQLGGVAASQYVQTNDSRLSDPRPPTPGSSNYIQNSTSSQASSNFNITGNGTAGGTLSGNLVNATTQYNMNGSRILSNSGTDNVFVGVGTGNTGSQNAFVGSKAGSANTTGFRNAFFGVSAGEANTTGAENAFFGANAGAGNTTGGGNAFFGGFAGRVNTTGFANSFFGDAAGQANTTIGNRVGNNNSFFGNNAGFANTTGAENTFAGSGSGSRTTEGVVNTFLGSGSGQGNVAGFFNVFVGGAAGSNNTGGGGNTVVGSFADVGSGNLTNATAIGASARVDASNALVLGSINGVGTGNADTKVGIGTTAPSNKLTVVQSTPSNFAGNFSTSGNPTGQSFGLVVSAGTDANDISFQARNQAGTNMFIVRGDNAVGIGTTIPDQRLSVNGNADKSSGGTTWAVFSDERLKNVKGRFTPGLKALLQLQPIRFQYRRDNALNLPSGNDEVGFSAQEVEKVLPEAVSRNKDGYLQLHSDPILWTMLNAIKEQQAQIATLKQVNSALNARLHRLEKRGKRR